MRLEPNKEKFSDQEAPRNAITLPEAQRKLLLSSVGVTLLYAAAAIGGLSDAAVGKTVTLIWAPSGIALAALLLLGRRMAPCVALGAFVANAWTGVPLEVAAGIALGNTLEALAGAWLLTRFAAFSSSLERRHDVIALIALSAVGSTMLSAFIGMFTLQASGLMTAEGWTGAWVKWWLGDMMGVLVVSPALLVWCANKAPAMSASRALEAVLLGAALITASYLIFDAPEMAGRGYYPAALAVFPFVIWGALRFGQRGASLLTLTVSALAVLGTRQGTGPFVVDAPVDSLVRWCTFAIIVAVTGLLLAASVAEQRRSQAELRQSHADLERQVGERTRDLQDANTELHREVTERRKVESELIRVSEVQQRAMGRELHDGLGQHLTSLALLGAALQQRLHERQAPEAELATRIVNLANEANAMAQAIGRGLYPVAFEFGGLSAALQQLAEETRTLSGMNCIFRCDTHVQSQDSMAALNLYRIAQEAVNNALKYSKASLIQIELTEVGVQHRLSITDDGIGIDLGQPVHQHGLGMHSMRYRAKLLGGVISIEPHSPGGTRIVVTVSDVGSTA